MPTKGPTRHEYKMPLGIIQNERKCLKFQKIPAHTDAHQYIPRFYPDMLFWPRYIKPPRCCCLGWANSDDNGCNWKEEDHKWGPSYTQACRRFQVGTGRTDLVCISLAPTNLCSLVFQISKKKKKKWKMAFIHLKLKVFIPAPYLCLILLKIDR